MNAPGRSAVLLLAIWLLGGACASSSMRQSADADDDTSLDKNDPPFVSLRKKRHVSRADLPPDLVRFYTANEGIGLGHDPDRMVRLARLDEVRRVGWKDLHIISLFPPPTDAWATFEGLRVGYTDMLDEIVYVLSAPGIPRGSVVMLGTGVMVGPAGADPNGPEGAIVVAGSWDEWIDRMRRHGQWGDSGVGADPETELWRRLAELNPHSNYAK